MNTRQGVPPVLELDFMAPRQRPGAMGWLMLGAGVLAVLGVLVEHLDLRERLADAQQRLARQQRAAHRAPGPLPAKSQMKLPDAELRRAAQLAQELQRPWLGMLADIESAADDDVALLAIESPSNRDGSSLRLTGEGRSLEAVFAYSRRLLARPSVDSARIESYEFKKGGTAETVVFKLTARWKASP
jgi:heme exporter protein D